MKQKEWFEEWFDSPYYHILYANRSEEEASKFISNLVQKLQIPAGAKILDIACGKGRHSLKLAQLGFNVTGIDLSQNNIAYAKQFECETLHFEVWDMRQVYKPNEFDFVLNLFSSFGYFKEENCNDRATVAFAENIKPGGTLVIDYINTEYAVKHIKDKEIIPRGDIQFHIQKKLENGFIKKKIQFLADGTHYEYEEQLAMINHFQFKNLLNHASVQLQQTFGDYDLNDFVAASSPRLILIAKK